MINIKFRICKDEGLAAFTSDWLDCWFLHPNQQDKYTFGSFTEAYNALSQYLNEHNLVYMTTSYGFQFFDSAYRQFQIKFVTIENPWRIGLAELLK